MDYEGVIAKLARNLALTKHMSTVTHAKSRLNYYLIKHYFTKVKFKLLPYLYYQISGKITPINK